MEYLLLSFIAGILTILAPCVLPVFPVVFGGSLENAKDKSRPIVITVSLAVSIVLFTLILKASTLLISIDPRFWNVLSGVIIIGFGIVSLFPNIWESIEVKTGLSQFSGGLLQKSSKRSGLLGNILVGASLGPVFASCSPTYGLIVAVILPTSFWVGLLNLVVYAAGLALVLLVLSLLGQKALSKLKWAVNPRGWFKKGLGIFFILLGLAIATGFIKQIEVALLDAGFADVTKIETRILERMDEQSSGDTSMNSEENKEIPPLSNPYPAAEIRGIEKWFNSEALSLKELKGKVVIIDFWTYSCINCIRTLPFLTDWHEKYADDGLIIIGVHAPEFAFEKIPANVEKAIAEYKVEYPVAMDNDFETWRAYDNRYWPAKYFIDKDGIVRYEHFGEGDYAESEEIIQELLAETGANLDVPIGGRDYEVPISSGQSPETYLGYRRGAWLVEKNSNEFKPNKIVDYSLQAESVLENNEWSLGGKWLVQEADSISKQSNARLRYKVSAKEVYLVMGSKTPSQVRVLVNGEVANEQNKGVDVGFNGIVQVQDYDLYRLVKMDEFTDEFTVELVFDRDIQINAFTFGS